MLHSLIWLHVLAQTNSSDTTGFLRQISGLLIITCAAGLVWIGLMAIIFQRGAERRRRVARGLEPLPPLHVSLYRWAQRLVNPASAAPRAQTSGVEADSTPAPDLSMLVDDLPEPDLADMVGLEDDEPVESGDLAHEFALETEPPAAIPDEEAAAENVIPVDDIEPEPQPGSAGVDYDEAVTDEFPPQEAREETPADAVELLRVWRDLSDGALILEIGGRRFRTLNDLRGTELERRFVTIVRDLSAMTQAAGRTPAPTPSAPRKASPKTPEPTAPDADAAAPPAGDEIDMTALSMSPGTMFRQMTRVAMGQGPEPVEHQPTLSLAEQIEDRLQERLESLPEYKGRKIHVRPAPDGSVRIEVDGVFYDGVGDVADDDVRALIADVVREWSDSQ